MLRWDTVALAVELAVATVLPSADLAVELWRSMASLHTAANTSVKFPSDSFRLSLPRLCIHPQQGSTLTLTVAASTTNCNQLCILHIMELSLMSWKLSSISKGCIEIISLSSAPQFIWSKIIWNLVISIELSCTPETMLAATHAQCKIWPVC